MNEELDQIEKNTLGNWFHDQKDKNVIGTKWVFINKLNVDGQVTRNKGRLVCKGYAQVEGIDLKKHLLPLSEWKLSRCFSLMHAQEKSRSTKWMLSQPF